jgi:hypothetical protein
MEITLDGCQDFLLEWFNRGISVHRETTRFCDAWERFPCLKIEEGLVQIEAGTQGMIC